MKRPLLILLAASVLFFLAGCFDTTEEITIDKNGGGVYQINADFKGLFELLDAMKAFDTSANSSLQNLPSNIDTTINLRSFTDTASSLTAEEKTLLRNATLNMVMNEKDKVFKVLMKYPYKDINDVQKIIKLSQSGNNFLGKALQGKESPLTDMQMNQDMGMPQLNNFYDVTIKKGFLEKKVNADKLKEFEENEQFAQMKQALEMMSEATMNTVIHLPKPVKKAEGANIKLSDDKKTVTINASLSDLFNDPNAFAYHVEY
ncbi:hypothetical protein OCK74_24975 [Chitinophagaceae bacterium LB-8]|uniref:Lipoprotein n=1 Tax=Paraflavisolibacter caeni TaxID=2982496 RepID=A0A9X3BJ64_9BACT|nr:hypothetical protein [Paraflavisolibacter caeni]MCU7552397.1 hypothetical protein [Paraflavisolibacter caeni]